MRFDLKCCGNVLLKNTWYSEANDVWPPNINKCQFWRYLSFTQSEDWWLVSRICLAWVSPQGFRGIQDGIAKELLIWEKVWPRLKRPRIGPLMQWPLNSALSDWRAITGTEPYSCTTDVAVMRGNHERADDQSCALLVTIPCEGRAKQAEHFSVLYVQQMQTATVNQ